MNFSFKVLNISLCLNTFKIIAAALVLIVKFLTDWGAVLSTKLMVLLQPGVGKVFSRAQELMTVQDHFINLLNHWNLWVDHLHQAFILFKRFWSWWISRIIQRFWLCWLKSIKGLKLSCAIYWGRKRLNTCLMILIYLYLCFRLNFCNSDRTLKLLWIRGLFWFLCWITITLI